MATRPANWRRTAQRAAQLTSAQHQRQNPSNRIGNVPEDVLIDFFELAVSRLEESRLAPLARGTGSKLFTQRDEWRETSEAAAELLATHIRDLRARQRQALLALSASSVSSTCSSSSSFFSF